MAIAIYVVNFKASSIDTTKPATIEIKNRTENNHILAEYPSTQVRTVYGYVGAPADLYLTAWRSPRIQRSGAAGEGGGLHPHIRRGDRGPSLSVITRSYIGLHLFL